MRQARLDRASICWVAGGRQVMRWCYEGASWGDKKLHTPYYRVDAVASAVASQVSQSPAPTRVAD
jgi:hypothetical protein